MDLNTSHVNVNRCFVHFVSPSKSYLNTSHVNVNHLLALELCLEILNLNTSHVNVNQDLNLIERRVTTFKYISC